MDNVSRALRISDPSLFWDYVIYDLCHLGQRYVQQQIAEIETNIELKIRTRIETEKETGKAIETGMFLLFLFRCQKR